MKGSKDISHVMSSKFKMYCVIGDPIDHSLSPIMHNSAFKALGINSCYISYRVTKSELKSAVQSLKSIDISGFNVTIPHKIHIIKYMDELDESSSQSTAVNTVKNSHGKFIGYNTDVYGFVTPLHNRNIKFNGMKVLILGAGGAAYAIVTALSRESGISRVTVFNRSKINALKLLKHASKLGLNCNFQELDNLQNVAFDSNLIINATSLGLNNEESPISSKNIDKNTIVYDIVYTPIYTDLIKNARKVGATVIYGYEMLLEQGAQAFKIWTGLDAPLDVMKKSLLGIFGEPL